MALPNVPPPPQLRALEQLLSHDANWQRQNLARAALQLPYPLRVAPWRPVPGAPATTAADLAKTRRVLSRLSRLDPKLARLQSALARRGPRQAHGARAMGDLRAALRALHGLCGRVRQSFRRCKAHRADRRPDGAAFMVGRSSPHSERGPLPHR